MSKPIKFFIIPLILFVIFSVGIFGALATGLVPDPTGATNASTSCPEGYKGNCGNYQLNDFMQIALIVSQFILGIVGSLALLAFVIGGLMWLLSAGRAEMVEKGKQTIIGAAVGLVIVFTSYMIIQLVYTALDIPGSGSGGWATFNSDKK